MTSNDYVAIEAWIDNKHVEFKAKKLLNASEVDVLFERIITSVYDEDGEYMPQYFEYIWRRGVIEAYTDFVMPENTDEAYIKVKLETDYQIKDHHVVFQVLYVTPEDEAEGKQTWIYNEIDDCYYYVGYIASDKVATFNTGIYVTNDINNIDKNQPVELSITVYAIQRHYKAYTFAEEWTFAPDEWKEAIAQYDIVN